MASFNQNWGNRGRIHGGEWYGNRNPRDGYNINRRFTPTGVVYPDMPKVYITKRPEDTTDESQLDFINHEYLFRYGIEVPTGDDDGLRRFREPQMDPTLEPPVIRFTDDQQMIQELKDKNLAQTDNNDILENYNVYRMGKRKIFCEVLRNEELISLNGMKTSDLSHFACFAGTIVDILLAPTLFATKIKPVESWHILAQKSPSDGLIHLHTTDGKDDLTHYDSKMLKARAERHEPLNLDYSQIHRRLNFKRMLTSDDPLKEMSESRKFYDVIQMDFGKNRLIVLKELDAVDSKGKPVKIQMRDDFSGDKINRRKSRFFEHKMFFLWCHSKIGNYSKQIIGVMDNGSHDDEDDDDSPEDQMRLKSTEVIQLDSDEQVLDYIKRESGSRRFGRNDSTEPWVAQDSFSFLNRFLNFISDHVSKPSNVGKVYCFKFQKEWFIRHGDNCFIHPSRSSVRSLYEL